MADSKWGTDKNFLLHLYRSLVRPKLDYGCIVCGSVRTSYLKSLDAICLGAFRTSPVDSLYVVANELPIDLRRLKLPAFDCVFNPQYEHL